MKRSIVSILILAGSLLALLACVEYPYGDDLRFSVFKPAYFSYHDFHPLDYTSQSFHPYDEDTIRNIDDNVILWQQYCKHKVDLKAIDSAVYKLDTTEVSNPNSTNRMIAYLYHTKDSSAIQYLLFAKRCEDYNMVYDDPWERTDVLDIPQRSISIHTALDRAAAAKNKKIGLRYAFQAMRLSYYNTQQPADSITLSKTYQTYFSHRKKKDIIDYWAMYFWNMTNNDPVVSNYYLSIIFYNVPDKRFMARQMYDRSILLSKTLKLAKNNKERAGIYLLDGINNPGKALKQIQEVYHCAHHSKGAGFLLLREINKLEDWIYTPYYTCFTPSTSDAYWESDIPWKTTLNRMHRDKAYAAEVLQFISSIDINQTNDPVFWKTSKAYLYFMTDAYDSGIALVDQLQHTVKLTGKENISLNVIRALCLTARQPVGNAIIPDAIKPTLMQFYNQDNYQLIFAISRELEYKGNTTDAALLLSKVNNNINDQYWGEGTGLSNMIFWITPKDKSTNGLGYYDDYFFYLDAQYKASQVDALIHSINNAAATDSFTTWEYSTAKKDIDRLYDLLGTKYIRKNDLPKALAAFKSVNDTLWASDQYPYKAYLDANPFYANIYSEHRQNAADTIHFTKTTITRQLIDYLDKASDSKNPDRDYDYFLAANCYLNMTPDGNSWMMARYYNGYNGADVEQEFGCDELAKMYYLKAKQATKSKKFAALCLRMAARCEAGNNKYITELKNYYPEYYDDLVSNCQSFNEYFSAR